MPSSARAVACLGLLAAAAVAFAQTPEAEIEAPDDSARLVEVLREAHVRTKAVGTQYAISVDGQTVVTAAFGHARLEDQVPVTGDTRFLAMSVTKAFVGAALVKAASAELVDLDVPVRTYLPDLPLVDHPAITLRTLAAHTAGLPHLNHPDRKAFYVERYTTARDALEAVAEQRDRTHDPGTEYRYSSGNYNAIAAALEAVSGQPFPAYLEAAILAPMGLTGTRMLDVLDPTPNLARNYTLYDAWDYHDLDSPQVVPTWDYSFNMGGGGMISTARDLETFGRAFLKPGFFSAEELELFRRPIAPDSESSWSFGWILGETESGRSRLRISGATIGVMASLLVMPDEQVVAAALTNSWGENARDGEVIFGVVERVVESLLDSATD